MMENIVTVQRTYDAPIERVWDALTNKDQMKQWYFDVSDFKPEPGFKFEFTGGDESVSYRHFCEVVEADKPNRLSYTWRYENIEGTSLVTIDLKSENENRTHVKLTHSGLDFKTDDKNFQPSSFNAGWNEIIGTSLRNFVEKDVFTKSVSIKAGAAAIWDIILNPNHDWANAFGGGALAETDWKQGSRIVWTDLQGNIGANGIIEILDPEKHLQLHYYDDLDPNTNTPLGEYYEHFWLTPTDDGTELRVETGRLQKFYLNTQIPMWEDALERIREKAENPK
jgi:uncharacterized protein YndB with AHSA1/START domain